MTWDRRTLLLGTGALFVAGCTPSHASSAATSGAATGSTSASPSPSASSASPSATTAAPTSSAPVAAKLPAMTAWSADGNEIQGAVKLVATRMIEALGNWDGAHAGVAAAGARLSALGIDPGFAAQVTGVVTGGSAAAMQVIDAQYGGLLTSTASVLIPTRQWVVDAQGNQSERGWTFDVRLSAASPAWHVTAVNPSVPGQAAAVDSLATQVLGSARIDLPPASRADIASGQVHDSVLRAMLTLSQKYTIGVSVVRSGHPQYVFGTTRLSDHPRGRAFDTWRINGVPVVAGTTPRSLVTGYMQAAAAAGSYNVGGPYLLSGSVYFSDQTHHDHVHAGFST
jgi:hypothetical protein